VPGLFITRGSSLRIPAGGLVLPLDDRPPPPVQVELLLDMWDRWLEISSNEVGAAEAAHKRLLESLGAPDTERGAALESEFNAALLAIAASASAIDAFYASVKQRIPPHPDERAWAKNRTARDKRIVEVFKIAFVLKREHPKEIASLLRTLFTLRGQAVHPPSKFQPPSYHRDLDAGVEWRFGQFSAENARAAFDSTAKLLRHLLGVPKAGLDELEQWIPSAQGLLAQAVGDARSDA
jgi:hypothetical protein